jgi:hypothetical protein
MAALPFLDGVEMLVQLAIQLFETWTSVAPDEAVFEQAVAAAFGEEVERRPDGRLRDGRLLGRGRATRRLGRRRAARGLGRERPRAVLPGVRDRAEAGKLLRCA